MTTAVRLGVQTPRLSNIPPFFTTLGEDAVDLAAVAGIDLLPWEEDLVLQAHGKRRDGKWASSQVCLLAPRQNGKNVVIEVRELSSLFLLGERKILHTAQEFKTCKDAFMSLSSRIDSIPDLQNLCQLPHRTSNEEVSIRLKTGAYCRYIARSKNSGRGFREVDLVICDEAYELSDEAVAALRPTQSAAPNAQTWFTSSAGMGESETLAKIRERGITHGSNRLLFAEWSADPEADLDDRDAWAIANPSLGSSFMSEEFLSEQRELLGDVQFAREHMGIWDDPRVNSVIPPEVWRDTKKLADDPEARIVGDFAVSVDISPDRATASIAVAGRTASGKPCVQVLENGRGTAWIVDCLLKLTNSSRPPLAIAIDAGSAAGSLIPALGEVGIEALPLSMRDLVQSCGAFFDAAFGGNMIHLDDPRLATAVNGATKRSVGTTGGWAWGRRDTSVDISPLVAATQAMHALTLMSIPDVEEPKRSGKVW